MPDVAGPFDGQPWTQSQWYRDAPFRSPSGVYGNPAASASAGDLGLSFNGLTWSVGLGRAHVRGMGFERTGTAATGTVATNTSGNPRVDRLVVRRDLAAKTGAVVLLQGTPAASPVAPTVQQLEDGQFDLPLFQFTVPANSGTTITGVVDERTWIEPETGEIGYPEVNCTINGGWTAVSQRTVRVQKTRRDRVSISGWFNNAGAYTPDGTQTPITIPVGFRPAQSQIVLIPVAGARAVLGSILTTGLIRLDALVAGTSPIPASAAHFLDTIEYSLTYTGL